MVNTEAPRPEYWVVRIITRRVNNVAVPLSVAMFAEPERTEVLRRITEGRLAALDDGRIGEPAEVYEDEEKAHAGRLGFVARYPGEVFAVIIVMNVTI